MQPTLKNILIIGLSLVGLLEGKTIDELKVAYEVKMLAIGNNYRANLEKLGMGYGKALDQVQKKLQKAARLDDVLKVVQEKKDLKAEKWPLGQLDASAPSELIRVRKIYETSKIRADRDHAKAVIETSERMEALLEKQMKSLTRAGNISEAKKALDLQAAIQNDPKIKAAKELVKRVRLNQSAPIAMRIRRSGDDLEVLVRYDKRGKVSLDSPVENVVEVTGGRKEKGETKATLLGEFVGAKGYEPAIFTAFDSDMSKIEPPMRARGFEIEPRVKIEKSSALKVTLPNKAENPRLSWPRLLTSTSSPSLVKLDFKYFIPRENKKFQGFSCHWGSGARFENKILDRKGAWVSTSLVSESLNEQETLRIYGEELPFADGLFSGDGESIYLDDFKITYLSFSAHVVADYDNGKIAGQLVQDRAAQKALVLGGKLVSSQTE